MFIGGIQYLTELGKPRYWVPSINMAVLGFMISKLSKILGTIYKHGCTGF
jgi:hypothetical protein